MAELKATPGPWAYQCGIIRAPHLGMRSGKIADVSIAFKDSATRDANAHLIAAAPALYEACSEMVRLSQMTLEESLREPEESGNYAAFNRAVAALRLARGEQS